MVEISAPRSHYAAAPPESWGLLPRHVRHSTGLPCDGLNGTVVWLPHSEQMTCVSIRPLAPPCLLALHSLQCFGRFKNPFVLKNCCSPAENTNITPQSIHSTSRSANPISPPNSKQVQGRVNCDRRGPSVKLDAYRACYAFTFGLASFCLSG